MTELDEMIRSLSTSEEVDDLRRADIRRATRARLYRAIREESHGRESQTGLVAQEAPAGASVGDRGRYRGGACRRVVPGAERRWFRFRGECAGARQRSCARSRDGTGEAKAVLARIAHIAATTPASSVPSVNQSVHRGI